jgi:hypothetical protein
VLGVWAAKGSERKGDKSGDRKGDRKGDKDGDKTGDKLEIGLSLRFPSKAQSNIGWFPISASSDPAKCSTLAVLRQNGRAKVRIRWWGWNRWCGGDSSFGILVLHC